MSDNTPMQACDYLYGVRSGLNNPDHWTTGTWEKHDVVVKPGRDERGRFVKGGTYRQVVQRCLMGQLGAVCHGDGNHFEYNLPEVDTPEFNAARLLALAIDPTVDDVARESRENYITGFGPGSYYWKSVTRYADDDELEERYKLFQREVDAEYVRVYTSTIMEYNDTRLTYEYTIDPDPARKVEAHKQILATVDKALEICFAEAKAKK